MATSFVPNPNIHNSAVAPATKPKPIWSVLRSERVSWKTGTRDYNPDVMASREAAGVLRAHVKAGAGNAAVLDRIAEMADILEVIGFVALPRRLPVTSVSVREWFARPFGHLARTASL